MKDRVDSYTGEIGVVVKYLMINPNKTGEDLLPVTGTHLDIGNGVDGAATALWATSPAANAIAVEFTPRRT